MKTVLSFRKSKVFSRTRFQSLKGKTKARVYCNAETCRDPNVPLIFNWACAAAWMIFVAGHRRCSCFPFALTASSCIYLSDPRMVPPSNYGSVPPLDAEAALAVTREAMAAQDGALEELSASVAGVKQTALTMEAEVRDGNEELDTLGGGVGRAADDVRRQASRVRAPVR